MKVKQKNIRSLYDALSLLRGFLGTKEQVILERRLLVMQMLIDGATYFQIQDKLKVGPDTIRQVRYFLTGKARVGRASRKGYSKTYKKRREELPASDWQRFVAKYPSRNLLLKLLAKK